MARIVKIATTSLATLENVAPPYNLRHPDPAATRALGLSLLDAAAAAGADLAVLPETFVAAGLPSAAIPSVSESLDGPTLTAIAEKARAARMYVVAGAFVTEPSGVISNLAVLFDRKGDIVGAYSKRHPVAGEMGHGVMPGKGSAVFTTDFGRLGLAVCFDLNWPSLWREMAEDGAEIVAWISAYEGGFPLAVNAWTYGYPIVSSVWPYRARVIERTGRIVAETSRWSRLAVYELDLDMRLYHTDFQHDRILKIQTAYGERVRIETLGEEHLFTLSSLDANLPIEQVAAEYDLVEYQPYIARCTADQQAALRAAGGQTR